MPSNEKDKECLGSWLLYTSKLTNNDILSDSIRKNINNTTYPQENIVHQLDSSPTIYKGCCRGEPQILEVVQ